jgi:hypothetical protein
MDTKLTLKLDKEIINRAKVYAESKKISLSKLIESYLQLLTKENSTKEEISPLVESLSGVIKLPKKYDDKDDYTDYLTQKYQ